MKNTKIQWCHSTVNPVMGCDGCELWPPVANVVAIILADLRRLKSWPTRDVGNALAKVVGDRVTSELYRDRYVVSEKLAAILGYDAVQVRQVVDLIREKCKCYAGILGTIRARHQGYADNFESPKLYSGRVAEASQWGSPKAPEISHKPWLCGLPRLVFLSDMGDALSPPVPFAYLRTEIIDNVVSEAGRHHIWLWLTKRPGRMAEFSGWLGNQGVPWPDNLVAMTTVTGQRFAQRANQLRRVPSKWRGLSLEPLFEPIDIDLQGIDWVIVGGGSDALAQPFHVEWALELKTKCAKEGVAFFFKQAGKYPFIDGKPYALNDKHGGDWSEWPKAWQVREFPSAFRVLAKKQNK